METVVAAVITAFAAVVGPIVTLKAAAKISSAKKQATENIDRAESVADAQWLVIDRLRLENARLEAEIVQLREGCE